MSRLDRHVAMVQNKLALGRFLHALAWATLVWAGALWLGLTVYKVTLVRPVRPEWWIWGGLALCPIVALVYAIFRRPTRHEAAVAIDERLALKEKFSTALYARPLNDPFAQAAVKDAERTADNVSLHKRFPLELPRTSLGTAGIIALVLLTHLFLPRMDLFGKEEKRIAQQTEQRKIEEAKKAVEKALQVIVQTEAKGVADEEVIKQAKRDLEPLINAPMKDPEKAKRSAARALEDLNQALKDKIASNQRIADVQSNSDAFKSLMPPSDEKGPVAEAQRDIAKGEFNKAIEDIAKAVEKFDKMDDAEKKKAAEQMQNMAKQLQQMAENKQMQQQMQQQLQNMGMNQQQAQQAQQLMQQAAQGDKKAQQQLQQMAQQAMQQMAQQNPQQAQQLQQQVQQMMKQMQAQANTQQQAQQMAQAAQQMAQAMQQAAQQQGQQQQGQQQANAQQQGQQQGQQPGQQQGQQPGQQQGGQQQQQQQMAQAAQAMQQQLQAMQAMKADAQQVAAAQAAAAAAAQDAANAMNGGQQGAQPGQQANGQWGQGQQGQWNNNMNQNNAGPQQGRGGGVAAGDRTFKEQAPYQIKEEISQSQDIDSGKILATTLIKAKSVRGESTVGEAIVAPPPEQEATDEIEQERISRPAQQAVKEYFSAWQKDAGVPAPAPAPAGTTN